MCCECFLQFYSSVTCLPLHSQNTFLLLEDYQQNRLAEIISALDSINRCRKVCGEKHTHTCHIYTLCSSSLFFVDYVKNLVQQIQTFFRSVEMLYSCTISLSVFVWLCQTVCVYACVHACTLLLIKYLAVLLHNAVICLHTQHCLILSCFILTSPVNI